MTFKMETCESPCARPVARYRSGIAWTLALMISWMLGCELRTDVPPHPRQQSAGVVLGDSDLDRPGRKAGTPAPEESTAKKKPRDQNVTFDDLEFDIERDGDFDPASLTDEIRELEGQSVVLRGFILAASVYQQRGIRQFVLVRDNQECCFGPGAYIYHNCQVECVPDVSTNFSIRPVVVHGILNFKPLVGPDGKCLSVYHITATRVE